MNTAAKVRERKEQHPADYCADPRCLWRVKHNGGPDTPCPTHAPRLNTPDDCYADKSHSAHALYAPGESCRYCGYVAPADNTRGQS